MSKIIYLFDEGVLIPEDEVEENDIGVEQAYDKDVYYAQRLYIRYLDENELNLEIQKRSEQVKQNEYLIITKQPELLKDLKEEEDYDGDGYIEEFIENFDFYLYEHIIKRETDLIVHKTIKN